MPLLVDIGAYLQAVGAGTLAVSIFEGQMPDSCDRGLLLSEYGSEPPDFTLADDPGVHREHPRFQLFCRHTDYTTGRALIELAYEQLSTIVNITIGSAFYLRVEPLQSPFSVNPPQDAQGRWEWFCNFRAWKYLG